MKNWLCRRERQFFVLDLVWGENLFALAKKVRPPDRVVSRAPAESRSRLPSRPTILASRSGELRFWTLADGHKPFRAIGRGVLDIPLDFLHTIVII